MATNITDFIRMIRQEADQLSARQVETRTPFASLLVASIRTTIEDIKLGADSDSFRELVMLDFLLRAHQAGYSSEEIGRFVEELTDRSSLSYDDAKSEDFSSL